MTTIRRLLAAVLLSGVLAATGSLAVAGAATAASSHAASTRDPGDGVRVSVEITDREVPAGPLVVVVGDGPFTVGGEIVVRGTGLAPRTLHEVWLESDPVLLGTVTTDADGAFELTATIPTSTLPGEHRIRVVVPGEGADVLSEPFVVIAVAGEPQEPGVEPGVTPSPGTGGTGGGSQASPRPGGLATTGTGLIGVAALAGLAVASGAVLRRRAARRATES